MSISAERRTIPLAGALLAVLLGGLLVGCSSTKCREGEQKCAGVCVDLQSDPDHCGGCDTVCGGSQVCDRGACSDGCSGGLTVCDRGCVDLQSDANHCGSCGNGCGPTEGCSLGRCVAAVADAGPPPGDLGPVTDGDVGVLPDAAPVCTEGVAIKTNGTLDLDLPVVQLSGRLTKNGQKVPDRIGSTSGRGRIELVRLEDGGTVRMPDFVASGEATYQGEVAAGTYDIYYDTKSCQQGVNPLPCQRVRLRDNVAIKTNGTLDLDLKVVQLSGRLTKNSQKVPDRIGSTSGRGRIELQRREDEGLVRMPDFVASGEATYQGEVAAGTYDIYYDTKSCQQGVNPLPCQRVRLRDNIAVKTNGTLDLDLPVVQLSGRLTKNSQKVPDRIGSTSGRGRIELQRREDEGLVRMPDFEATGEATYQGEVAAGTYDIYYDTKSCQQGVNPLPCQRVRLRDNIAVKTNGTLDLDLPVVQLSGRLTKNGQKVPDRIGSTSGRGRLELRRHEDQGIVRMPDFVASGEATYQGEVAAGVYDIFFDTQSCQQGVNPLPCQRVLLRGCGFGAGGI